MWLFHINFFSWILACACQIEKYDNKLLWFATAVVDNVMWVSFCCAYNFSKPLCCLFRVDLRPACCRAAAGLPDDRRTAVVLHPQVDQVHHQAPRRTACWHWTEHQSGWYVALVSRPCIPTFYICFYRSSWPLIILLKPLYVCACAM